MSSYWSVSMARTKSDIIFWVESRLSLQAAKWSEVESREERRGEKSVNELYILLCYKFVILVFFAASEAVLVEMDGET